MNIKALAVTAVFLISIGVGKQASCADDISAALQSAASLISDWQISPALQNNQDLSPLYNEREILKKMLTLEKNQRNEIAEKYFLAKTDSTIIIHMKILGMNIDFSVAQEALDNFDFVISKNEPIFEWRVSVEDSEYFAGNIASILYGPNSVTIGYWSKCANSGQAGCINNIANALLQKKNVGKKDLRDAIGLLKLVVKSGNTYGCAGEFSANQIAMLIHFSGITSHDDDELQWLQTARALRGQLEQAKNVPNPCHGAAFGLEEFMILGDRGQRKDDLLDEIVKQSSYPIEIDISNYLRGNLSETVLLQKHDTAGPRCEVLFYALWKSVQDGQRQKARLHYQAMEELPADICLDKRLYARKFGLGIVGK